MGRTGPRTIAALLLVGALVAWLVGPWGPGPVGEAPPAAEPGTAGAPLPPAVDAPGGSPLPPAVDAPPNAATLAGRRPEGDPEAGAALPPPVDTASLDPDLDLHGVVVRGDGTPIPGARIQAVERPWRRTTILDPAAFGEVVPGEATRSASDGSFRLRLARGQRVGLRVEAEGFERLERAACAAGQRLRLVLAPGVGLAVTLHDDAGRPVPDTDVRVFSRDRAAAHEVEETSRSDASGVARFEGLPARVVVWVDPKPLRLGGAGWTEATLPASGTHELTIVLPTGRTIRGLVTDARTNAPIAGARVGANWVLDRAVRTGPDGRYEFPGWNDRQGARDLHCEAEGYGRRVVEPGALEVVDFALEAGDEVVGRVVGSAGLPLPGARVASVPVGGGAGGAGTDTSRTTTTGPDGRFRLTSLLRTMEHAVVVTSPGMGRVLVDFAPRAEGPGTIDLGDVALSPGRRIEGRVLDATGAPVPDARVALAGANADRRRLLGGGESSARALYGTRETVSSDDRGRFRFDDLAAGGYTLSVQPTGGLAARRTVDLTAEADVLDADLRLPASTALVVRVRDARGQALAGAWVSARGATSGGRMARTDPEGRATLALEETETAVDVHWEASMDPQGRAFAPARGTPIPPGAAQLDVVLRDAIAVQGVVRGEDGAPVVRHLVTATRGGMPLTVAWTDEQGRFTLVLEDAGPVDLAVSAQLMRGGGAEAGFTGRLEGVLPGTKDVVVRAQRAVKDRRLTVRVRFPDGRPVAKAQVILSTVTGASASGLADEDGVCSLTDLLPGPWSVNAFHLEGGQLGGWLPGRAADVTAQGQTIDLTVREGRVVEGTVLDASGAPATGVSLAFVPRDGEDATAMSFTDEKGAFRLLVEPETALPARLVGTARGAASVTESIPTLPATGLVLRLPAR